MTIPGAAFKPGKQKIRNEPRVIHEIVGETPAEGKLTENSTSRY